VAKSRADRFGQRCRRSEPALRGAGAAWQFDGLNRQQYLVRVTGLSALPNK